MIRPLSHNEARELAHWRERLLRRVRELEKRIQRCLGDCGCKQCVNMEAKFEEAKDV